MINTKKLVSLILFLLILKEDTKEQLVDTFCVVFIQNIINQNPLHAHWIKK